MQMAKDKKSISQFHLKFFHLKLFIRINRAMALNCLGAISLAIQTLPKYAHAQTTPAAADGFSTVLVQFLPLVLIFGVFWLLLIRPQMKRQKEHQTKVSAIKKGDEILLASGIYGKVTDVLDEQKVMVEIASGVKVRVVKHMVSDVLTLKTPTPKNPAVANVKNNKKS